MRRVFAAGLAIAALLPTPPAWAAGVGISLPKLRVLTLDGDTSFGGSVQVIGGRFNVSRARVDLALDYAYTRDFARAGNYSFFDALAGLGMPFGITSAIYVMPAVDLHALAFVASPQGVDGPAYGVAPRLGVGYQPSNRFAVELDLSHAFLWGANAGGRALGGGMTTLELGGTVAF